MSESYIHNEIFDKIQSSLISLPVKNDKLFHNIHKDEYVFVVVIVQ